MVYLLQTEQSLQGFKETDPQLPGKHGKKKKIVPDKAQTLGGPNERICREEEAVIKALTAPSTSDK